jgi:carbamate kinase
MLRIVIALGGNALQENPKDKTAKSQLKTIQQNSKAIVDLIEEGHQVIIAHGNGPQVGQIVAAYEAAASETNPVMPFPECSAMSQGYIGFHIQQAIGDEMKKRGIKKDIATIITQVVVDKNDPAFNNLTKPIGSFFTEEQANQLEVEKGYVMKEDSGRGYRRIVASPMPKKIVEESVIRTLVDAGHVVITVGGGGIPVIDRGNGTLEGVPAVIDKDFASCKLAQDLNADVFLVLTGVEKVAVNYGKSNQRNLATLTKTEVLQYIKEGQFAPGSMLPKIKAALSFIEGRPERRSIITSLEKAKEAIKGTAGTVFKI